MSRENLCVVGGMPSEAVRSGHESLQAHGYIGVPLKPCHPVILLLNAYLSETNKTPYIEGLIR